MPDVLACVLLFHIAHRHCVQDLFLMVGFGVIGYLMKRLDIHAAPVILGIVLGKLMEEKMR